MHLEAKKIQLIEEVLKVSNVSTLAELEKVLKKSGSPKKVKTKMPSIYDFVGVISKRESVQMIQAIKEICEMINTDLYR